MPPSDASGGAGGAAIGADGRGLLEPARQGRVRGRQGQVRARRSPTTSSAQMCARASPRRRGRRGLRGRARWSHRATSARRTARWTSTSCVLEAYAFTIRPRRADRRGPFSRGHLRERLRSSGSRRRRSRKTAVGARPLLRPSTTRRRSRTGATRCSADGVEALIERRNPRRTGPASGDRSRRRRDAARVRAAVLRERRARSPNHRRRSHSRRARRRRAPVRRAATRFHALSLRWMRRRRARSDGAMADDRRSSAGSCSRRRAPTTTEQSPGRRTATAPTTSSAISSRRRSRRPSPPRWRRLPRLPLGGGEPQPDSESPADKTARVKAAGIAAESARGGQANGPPRRRPTLRASRRRSRR